MNLYQRTDRTYFECPSGKLLIADPFSMGIPWEEMEENVKRTTSKNSLVDLAYLPYGMLLRRPRVDIFSVFEHGDYVIFINWDSSLIQRNTAPYVKKPEEFLAGVITSMPPRYEGIIVDSMRYLCDHSLDDFFATLLIGDLEKYGLEKSQWKVPKFPTREDYTDLRIRPIFGIPFERWQAAMLKGDMDGIEENYRQIATVSPGLYTCEYDTEWGVMVVKPNAS